MGVGDWEDCVDGWAVVDPAPSTRKNFSHIRSDDNFFLCMQVGIYLTNIFTKYNENERTLLRPRPPHQKILVGLQKQRFYQTVRSRHAQSKESTCTERLERQSQVAWAQHVQD